MSVQSLGNGRWRVVAKTGIDPETGKPRYFDSTIKGTHQDAKNLEAEHILFDRKKFSGMTLKAYMESKWLPSLQNATNTIDYYTGTARRHIWPHIGDAVMRDIDVPMLRAYFDKLPEGSTRMACRKTLSACFSHATEDGVIQANPIMVMRKRDKAKSRGKRRRKPYRTFTLDECLKLQTVLRGTCIEALCLVMLGAGACREEACAHDWEDFDWGSSTSAVERAYTVTQSKGCEMKEPKDECRYRLLYHEGYARDRLFELSLGQTGPICKEPGTDRRMRPDRAQRLFGALCALHGLPTDVPLNHLRHTFATLQIDSGTDVATLRDLLGHSSTSTVTELYIIPREENLKKAQKGFGEIMDPRRRAPEGIFDGVRDAINP